MAPSSRRKRKREPTRAVAPIEAQTAQSPAGSPAAAYPSWVLLGPRGDCEAEGSYSTADARTVATAFTTTGRPIGVSLRLAAPPAESRVCVHFPHCADHSYATVIATHGNSLLIRTCFEQGFWRHRTSDADLFVYNSGAAAANPPRPPSLYLLPRYYDAELEEPRPQGHVNVNSLVKRWQHGDATGLVSRGEDELVVAVLRTVQVGNCTRRLEDGLWWAVPKGAELLVLRSGQWSVRRATISHCDDGEKQKLLHYWKADTVFPVGDGLLCWVDHSRGLLLLDVFDGDTESPVLRYVPLPIDQNQFHYEWSVDVDITAGAGGAMKCVAVLENFTATYDEPCCRRHAYRILTWMLRVDEDMTWVMEDVVYGADLWALDAYKGLPRVPLEYPILSMDDPNIICFLCEDKTKSIVMVDTRSNALVAVFHYPPGRGNPRGSRLFASKVSDYLNSCPNGNGNHGSSSVMNTCTVNLEARITADDGTRNSVPPLSTRKLPAGPVDVSEGASAEGTILAELQEIPGLAREDMLKGYSVLRYDSSGRRLRALLGLPISLRKDWLLMEIKDSEACSTCSACTAHLEHGS